MQSQHSDNICWQALLLSLLWNFHKSFVYDGHFITHCDVLIEYYLSFYKALLGYVLDNGAFPATLKASNSARADFF